MMADFLQVHIFVSCVGDDQAAGSREQPLRTLDRALALARSIETEHENIVARVFVKAGAYWVAIGQREAELATKQQTH